MQAYVTVTLVKMVDHVSLGPTVLDMIVIVSTIFLALTVKTVSCKIQC